MNRVMIDNAIRAKLKNLGESVELCDESGRTLGHFLPAKLYERLIYDLANATISDEELERRLQEPGGYSLQEIWDELTASSRFCASGSSPDTLPCHGPVSSDRVL